MHGKVVGLAAAVALLASVGITNANAKGPVQLTDAQLDKITAGDSASILASSTQLLNTLVATSTNTVVALSGFTTNSLNFFNAFLTFTP